MRLRRHKKSVASERERGIVFKVLMSKPAIVKCPICGKPNEFFAEPVGTFCSQRCKLVDLGAWLNEDYRISEPLRPDHFVEMEEEEEGNGN